ncbi:MAG: glycosyltransferase family 39 protein [Candidatus Methanofastidiosa archaeon]|nr:glycosyltransferase family 39 protein [Candidatus Methanofastidiosa archaeon]
MGEKGILKWIRRHDLALILLVYFFGVYIRLAPKLEMDSHLPVFLGDVWYRICMSQYILDFHALPIPDIRYLPYGDVPLWYPPLSMLFFAGVSAVSNLDLPTVMTRVVPFIEAFTPIPAYFLAKEWFGRNVARIALVMMAITPSFILYSSIADPQVFTLMVIPVVLIFLSRQQYGFSAKASVGIGILLGINFMTHLSYFITVVAMILYVMARWFDRKPVRNEIKFLAISLGISLLISSWWWLPDFLFYWWIFIITTSTLLQTFGSHFSSYGTPFMILGFMGFGYMLVNRLSYLNDSANRNVKHLIALSLAFSALCGVFLGKGVTVPVISILALLYAFVMMISLKSNDRTPAIISVVIALITGGVASFVAHRAGNIGTWTKTFTFVPAIFANMYEGIAILIVVIFILMMLSVVMSRNISKRAYVTPLLSLASFIFLLLLIMVVGNQLSKGEIVDTLKGYLSGYNLLAPMSVVLIPTLFRYQYDGRISKYIVDHKYSTFMVLWTIFLLYEVFSENILSIIREYGLMWETTVRPLEGYRFYIFLAQPFSIMAAIMIEEVRKHKKAYLYGFMLFIVGMGYISMEGFSMPDYDMDFKITNSGVFIEDYNAAIWFRDNSTYDDRMVADYYTGQMFSGVCSGRSLIGGLFPLRNIDFNEYIKAPAKVQDDIYDFYKTSDLDLTLTIAERYGITHVFISDNMVGRGWLGSYKDSSFGVPVNWNKFFGSDMFKIVYQDKSNPYNKVYILEIVK